MENLYSMVHSASTPQTLIYYKLICIDETHAIIAEQQLNNAETNKIKAKRLGRAVIASINKDNMEQNELSEINCLLSSVRVHAMAYEDELSQYDIDVIEAMNGLGT